MTWSREDLGYAGATAFAVALLIYLVAGNFGLIPTPFSTQDTAFDSPSVLGVDAIAANSAPDTDVVVEPAPAPSLTPSNEPGVPVDPRPGQDTAAPSVSITTAAGAQVSVDQPASVEGVARDVGVGVDEVQVTFTAQTGQQTVPATVTCEGAARTSCRWRAQIPDAAGSYTVSARASDRRGNTSNSKPIEITVVNGGNPVTDVTDMLGTSSLSEDAPSLIESLTAPLPKLLP